MNVPKRITGVTVKTVLDGRVVDVVFRSPYRWRIYEGEREVTKDYGFSGRIVSHDDPRFAAFHTEVETGEISCRLQVS